MFVGYRQHPVTGVGDALQNTENEQRAEQRQALHQHAAVQRTDDGRK